MKTMVKTFVIIIATCFFYAVPQKANAQPAVSFQVFYDDLSPYGQWIDDPDYGYVWAPDAGPGFVPYSTDGHWVYTNYGWTWVSDYPWGWAPFHYGRWAYEDDYGWIWIPGEEWGPAWVEWNMCDGYYGWAPLGPGFSVGLYGYYSVPASYWVFVSSRYFGDRDMDRYYEPRDHNENFIRRSTPINITGSNGNVNYYTGPQRTQVERATGRQVNLYTVSERTSPGVSVGKNTVSIYRPTVSARTSRNANPAPAHVVSSRRNTENNNGVNRGIHPANRSNNNRGNNAKEQRPVVPTQRNVPQPQDRVKTRQREPQINRQQQQRTQPPVRQQPAPQHTQPPINRQPAPQPVPQQRSQPQREPMNQRMQPPPQTPYRGSPPHMPSNRRGR